MKDLPPPKADILFRSSLQAYHHVKEQQKLKEEAKKMKVSLLSILYPSPSISFILSIILSFPFSSVYSTYSITSFLFLLSILARAHVVFLYVVVVYEVVHVFPVCCCSSSSFRFLQDCPHHRSSIAPSYYALNTSNPNNVHISYALLIYIHLPKPNVRKIGRNYSSQFYPPRQI